MPSDSRLQAADQPIRHYTTVYTSIQGDDVSSSSDANRSRPDQRAAKPSRIQIGENDRAIVRHLYNYGLLSQTQFERLLERSRSTVQRLLRRLYDHRYVERLFLPETRFGSSPALYVLDKEGFALLRSMGLDDFSGLPTRNIKRMFIEHAIAISEVHIAVEKACQKAGYSLDVWLNDNRLKSLYQKGNPIAIPGQKELISLIPDSFFSITIPNEGTTHCFLEVDRGSMDVGRFKKKIEAYVVLYRSGEFSRRHNAQGFRVFTVVDAVTDKHRQHLTSAVAKIPAIGRRFWFTHMKQVSPTTILSAPIWHIAGSDSGVPLISL